MGGGYGGGLLSPKKEACQGRRDCPPGLQVLSRGTGGLPMVFSGSHPSPKRGYFGSFTCCLKQLISFLALGNS